jgi:hypothetical protein
MIIAIRENGVRGGIQKNWPEANSLQANLILIDLDVTNYTSQEPR